MKKILGILWRTDWTLNWTKGKSRLYLQTYLNEIMYHTNEEYLNAYWGRYIYLNISFNFWTILFKIFWHLYPREEQFNLCRRSYRRLNPENPKSMRTRTFNDWKNVHRNLRQIWNRAIRCGIRTITSHINKLLRLWLSLDGLLIASINYTIIWAVLEHGLRGFIYAQDYFIDGP